MQNFAESSIPEVKLIDFGCIPVDTVATKYIYLENIADVSINGCVVFVRPTYLPTILAFFLLTLLLQTHFTKVNFLI